MNLFADLLKERRRCERKITILNSVALTALIKGYSQKILLSNCRSYGAFTKKNRLILVYSSVFCTILLVLNNSFMTKKLLTQNSQLSTYRSPIPSTKPHINTKLIIIEILTKSPAILESYPSSSAKGSKVIPTGRIIQTSTILRYRGSKGRL